MVIHITRGDKSRDDEELANVDEYLNIMNSQECLYEEFKTKTAYLLGLRL
jgi:hypothetical protein